MTGLGFGGSEKVGGGELEESELPEKPEAAHLKWEIPGRVSR